MPDLQQNPYPIVGVVQNARTGVTVKGINLNTGGTEEVVTVSDGSYIIDPANMTGGYSNGDIIRISSGNWIVDVIVDITNYPDGKEKNINRQISINQKKVSRGASLERGISCGV